MVFTKENAIKYRLLRSQLAAGKRTSAACKTSRLNTSRAASAAMAREQPLHEAMLKEGSEEPPVTRSKTQGTARQTRQVSANSAIVVGQGGNEKHLAHARGTETTPPTYDSPTEPGDDELVVTHDVANQRFLVHLENPRQGRRKKRPRDEHEDEPEDHAYLAYSVDQPAEIGGSTPVMDIYHTWTPSLARGRGLARKLCDEAVLYATEQGMLVSPSCSYVRDTYTPRYSQLHGLFIFFRHQQHDQFEGYQ